MQAIQPRTLAKHGDSIPSLVDQYCHLEVQILNYTGDMVEFLFLCKDPDCIFQHILQLLVQFAHTVQQAVAVVQ